MMLGGESPSVSCTAFAFNQQIYDSSLTHSSHMCYNYYQGDYACGAVSLNLGVRVMHAPRKDLLSFEADTQIIIIKVNVVL